MRADRLLSEVLLLQAHGRLSGREMAERLEVSERTVHRDMEALSTAGVPVYALRGSQGGWKLDEHWRTQVPGLEDAELRALLMAQPRVIGDTKLAAAAERAIGKLMAALPVPMRAKAASMRQRLHVDTTGWRGTSENLAMLPVVQDAVTRDRKLSFRYRRPGAEPEARVVDPLGLVSKGSSWYLVANTPRGMRTYRVSRIEKARLLEKPSQRPGDFDLATYWKTSTAQFVEAWNRFEAVLRLDPRAANWVKMWRVASPVDGAQNPDAEGWSTFRVQFEAEEEASFVVLGLGVRAEVVEPASLRVRVAEEITRVIERSQKLSAIQT
jgi:predicted DNA-binding transcriptional regulator YafY